METNRGPWLAAGQAAAVLGVLLLPFSSLEILSRPHVTAASALLALAAAFAAADALRARAAWRAFRPDPMVAAFLGWLLVSFAAGRLLWPKRLPGGADDFGREFAQVLLFLAIVPPALAWLFRKGASRTPGALLLAAAAAAAIHLVPALDQFLDPETFSGTAVAGCFSNPGLRDIREQGNAHLLGLFFAGTLPALAAVAASPRQIGRAWARAGIALLAAAGAFLTLSFGPFIAILAASAFAAALRSRRAAAIAGIAALLLLSFPSSGPRARFAAFRDSLSLFETVPTQGSDGKTPGGVVAQSGGSSLVVSRRYVRWMLCANLSGAYFPFGTGFGTSQARMSEAYGFNRDLSIPNPNRALELRDPYTEHTYLLLAAETGVPGAALFLAWLAALVAAGVRRSRGDPDPVGAALGAAAAAGLLGLAIAGIFAPILNRTTLPLLALLAAWVRPDPAESASPTGKP